MICALRPLLPSFILLAFSCKKESSPTGPVDSNTGKITTGPTITVVHQSIPPSGGTITVNEPGSPINGFSLVVPPDGYAQGQDFTIAYAEIKSHQLGPKINPVAPLIKIGSLGGYSEYPMQIRIPIKLPRGHFAMAFFLNEATGKMEGLPVEALDSVSVTVGTLHVSPAEAGTSKGLLRIVDRTGRALRRTEHQRPVVLPGAAASCGSAALSPVRRALQPERSRVRLV